MRSGQKHTAEARAKISAAQMGNQYALGHRHTPESRERIGAARKGKDGLMGRVVSPETRAKMGTAKVGNQYALGCKRSPEWRAKVRAALSGSKSPCWLGGISRAPYAWSFNAELKEEVRRRDGYKCQLCGAPQAEFNRRLDVHHIDYDKKNSDPVNLIALCRLCHTKTNGNREHWIAVFQAMAIKRSIAELEKRSK
jgi:hypothetical protein